MIILERVNADLIWFYLSNTRVPIRREEGTLVSHSAQQIKSSKWVESELFKKDFQWIHFRIETLVEKNRDCLRVIQHNMSTFVNSNSELWLGRTNAGEVDERLAGNNSDWSRSRWMICDGLVHIQAVAAPLCTSWNQYAAQTQPHWDLLLQASLPMARRIPIIKSSNQRTSENNY